MAKKGLLHELHIWLLAVEFYELLQRTAVQAVIDSRGNTSVSPDLRTCCACRAYQHACDGLAFKFTEQMADSELPSPNPRRSYSTASSLTRICESSLSSFVVWQARSAMKMPPRRKMLLCTRPAP